MVLCTSHCCGVRARVCVLVRITLCPFLLCKHLDEDERDLVALPLFYFGYLVTVNVL